MLRFGMLDGATSTGLGAVIRTLDAPEAEARLNELSVLILDAVQHSASVNFMAEVPPSIVDSFWRRQFPEIAGSRTRLLIAERDGKLVGTVLLFLAQQPNAPHCADIGKLLVLSSARRQGIGRRLLLTAESLALEAGRTLLMLDTETGSAGEALYRTLGWTEFGRVPDHSYQPDGRLADTTFFYKILGPHRPPRQE